MGILLSGSLRPPLRFRRVLTGVRLVWGLALSGGGLRVKRLVPGGNPPQLMGRIPSPTKTPDLLGNPLILLDGAREGAEELPPPPIKKPSKIDSFILA